MRGGHKVLIPVFALGRAQELCLLLHTYWTRVGLKVRRSAVWRAGGGAVRYGVVRRAHVLSARVGSAALPMRVTPLGRDL